MSIVVLDPGHGGFDPGAIGEKTQEKSNNLALALAVGKLLEPYTQIYYTRTTDVAFGTDINSDLSNRIAEAKSLHPDIFISLHNNSFNKSARGIETHCYKLGGTDERLARAIQSQLATTIPEMIDRGVKVSNLYVTRKFDGTNTSACLVEFGFIDSEEAAILSNMGQAAMAIAKGVINFLGMQWKDSGKEVKKKVNDLVIFKWREDERAAGYLADHLHCPVAQVDNQTTPELLASVTNLYQVGGQRESSEAKLISGYGPLDTMEAVLKFIREGGK